MSIPSFFANIFGAGSRQAPLATENLVEHAAIADLLASINDGAAKHGVPTLVCRKCSMKYENRGTFFQGSPCPSCFPDGA
jgi:hypothetical protein